MNRNGKPHLGRYIPIHIVFITREAYIIIYNRGVRHERVRETREKIYNNIMLQRAIVFINVYQKN